MITMISHEVPDYHEIVLKNLITIISPEVPDYYDFS
jgi:hypothetical protein